MSTDTIIQQVRADGVTLALSATGTIKARGESQAVGRWLPALREHKADIIAALAADTRAPRAFRWRVMRTDGDPVDVFLAPAGTAADAVVGIEGAVSAVPDRLLTVGCSTCRHLRRPGLTDGYCGARPDLPPAYGPGHPLRQLPDDRGATCAAWEGPR